MSTWHYMFNGSAAGPVDDADLAARFARGEITGKTLLWRDGMSGWAAAREVPDAIALLSRAPASPVGSDARLAPPTSAAGIVAPPATPQLGDATGGPIPYKNPLALTAYYLGIFALIPLLGVPLAVAAIVCGMLGIGHRKRNPHARGLAHAWIGIGLGILVLGAHLAIILLIALGGRIGG